MSFKQAAVLAPVCFFLGEPHSGRAVALPLTEGHTHAGVLFICFNVDHRTLWGTLTDEAVADATQFYTTFYNAPKAIKVRAARSLMRVCGCALTRFSLRYFYLLLAITCRLLVTTRYV